MKFRMFVLSVTLAAAVFLTSCGGSNGNPPPPPPPTITDVTVSPTSATLNSGATQQFSATVSGTGNYDTTVSWYSCDSTGANCTKGGSSALGTISSGMYTAPTLAAGSSPLLATVKAVANGDASKSASATVTVNPPPLTQATLIWKDLETGGAGQSDFVGVAILNGNIVATGSGNVNASIPEVGLMFEYGTSGNILKQNNNFPMPLGQSISSINLVLAVGGNPTGLANIVAIDQNLTTSENYCPSVSYTGTIGGFALSQSTTYVGLSRNPSNPPVLATADTSGNFNCTTPLIDLPENSDARIGSIASGNGYLIVTGDVNANTGQSNIAGWVLKINPANNMVAGPKQLNNVILPRATVASENGQDFIYLVGSIIVSDGQLFWVDKIDASLNEADGWPKTWDAGNGSLHGNWGNFIVSNQASIGGVIIGGTSAKLPPNTDINAGDCVVAAFPPNGGQPPWSTRQSFDQGVDCVSTTISSSFSLAVVGSYKTHQSDQQAMMLYFALPH